MAAGTSLWAIHTSKRFCIVTMAIVNIVFRDGMVQSTSFLLFHAIQEQKTVGAGLYSFFNTGASCGWVVNANPRSIYRRDGDLDTFYRRLGEGGWAKNIWTGLAKVSVAPGFDPRTAQFVASRHTD